MADKGDTKESKIRVVQLDGLALLKIIKHCKENVPDVVTGQLLGFDVDGRLEVTNCFPILEDAEENDTYQVEMMRYLRKVNCDNNAVGWYHSAFLGSFLTQAVVRAQFDYQVKIPNSVVIVYDPFRTSGGKLALKAYRLTQKFMRLHRKMDFSQEAFTKAHADSQDIFEEVHIKVHNSSLVHGFLYELREKKQMSCQYDLLRTSPYAFLQKNMDLLSTSIEEYAAEQSKYQFQQRQLARERQQAAMRRTQQAEKLKRQGLDAMPDDPLTSTPPPSRLETFLISNQIVHHTKQIVSSSMQGLNKLFVIDALHQSKSSSAEEKKVEATPAVTQAKGKAAPAVAKDQESEDEDVGKKAPAPAPAKKATSSKPAPKKKGKN